MNNKRILYILFGILIITGLILIILISFLSKSNDEKSDICDEENLVIEFFEQDNTSISVIIKNNNDCTWNFKEFNEVRVDFDDGDSINFGLGENIGLPSNETHTFTIILDDEYKDKVAIKVVLVE